VLATSQAWTNKKRHWKIASEWRFLFGHIWRQPDSEKAEGFRAEPGL